MIQIIPKSAVLTYLVMFISQLNCAWDFILYQSFFQTRGIVLQEYGVNTIKYNYNEYSEESSEECAVCLCSIDEGDDVGELRCDHLFHRVCLDRWVGYGHATCPLCRNNLKQPAELGHQELILINFCAAAAAAVSSRDDRSTWWLR
ncbi:hypothetical protein ABFS82_12G083700 [Erythranthe guttata]|uniref:RING-type domain-containing protein n=1 Tax=Erythranthe guttata TaxID=4155 RepID=A0A022QJS8_ERYGU|nr:PREDICTED: E3 ubiquitin-protein ligase EL5-like [Erythranthe guttata]EYU28932.1 hypothetical protein MIMGU_mgv1a024839mg [Erythranthe guttata]|eukprot:XP_012847499.1 PREDICTED: E3 ubiquitin-protein ligase EL5-like [Erythranthe guttata]